MYMDKKQTECHHIVKHHIISSCKAVLNEAKWHNKVVQHTESNVQLK